MPFDIIVGMHVTNRAIGFAGKIPWKCRTDMKFFKEITTATRDGNKVNAVIMGRKTFESLHSPLPNRVNVVLSKSSNNLDETITKLESDPTIETIFVIGGEMVYKEAINHPKCDKIYLNTVHVVSDLLGADAFFPEIDPNMYELVQTTVMDATVTSYLYKRILSK